MEPNTNATFATWLDDVEFAGEEYEPISHQSSQVCAKPEYVAEVCGRFAGEGPDGDQKSCVVRGYN
jgi:hypothetical protein